MDDKNKIKSFTDLDTWRKAHRLVLMVYKITSNFPREELFGLVSQMRRAAVSVTSNIAEGFSRQSFKDKLRFYYNALGSLTEVQDQLLVARDVSYLKKSDFDQIVKETIIVHKLLNGFITKTKSFVKVI